MNTDLCSRIILPYCPSYESARQIFNRSIQKYPSSIIYCRNDDDAAQAVCYGASQKQEIRVRSGGHNYEGYCIGNGKMTVDTSPLKGIQLDNTGTLKIGGGVSNRELYHFLKQYGYPFPSGTCPTVNAVGLTQGGGWGHSSRMYGLACDSLVEAELIDASGRLITASEASHPDLFWALRGGGGGNFGVVTSLSYRLTPVVSHVTYVDIEYSRIDDLTALRFFQTWQAWTTGNEIRFAVLLSGKPPKLTLRFTRLLKRFGLQDDSRMQTFQTARLCRSSVSSRPERRVPPMLPWHSTPWAAKSEL